MSVETDNETGTDEQPAGPASEGASEGAFAGDPEPRARRRLDDPTLVAHAVHACLPLGLPLQVHTGYGDPDLTLHRADPTRDDAYSLITARGADGATGAAIVRGCSRDRAHRG